MAESDKERLKTFNEEVNCGLDRYGLCNEFREFLYIKADIDDSTPDFQLGTILRKGCGSTAESIPESLDPNGDIVESDFDMMLYSYTNVVFCNDPDFTFHPPEGTDPANVRAYYYDTSASHAGYGKLCKVGTTRATKEAGYLSHKAAMELFHDYFNDKTSHWLRGTRTNETHGPKVRVIFPSFSHMMHETEIVLAYPVVDGWPNCINEWFERVRKYGWPTEENIDIILKNGCHVVAIGYKNSSLTSYEWRLSTVLAEQTLVRSFNETQHKAHFVLKFIKNLVEEKTGRQDIFTSYHIKTLMLWMVQDNSRDIWRRENLIQCIEDCLDRLRKWFDNCNLPHYFIPDNNLIDTLSDDQCTSISNELSNIKKLVTDHLQVFRNLKQKMFHFTVSFNVYLESIFFVQLTENLVERQNLQMFCQSVSDKSLGQHVSLIYKMLQQHMKGCFKHVRAIRENKESNFKHTEELLLCSKDLDMASTKLKLANFYYTWGKTADAEACIALALKDENLKYYVSYPYAQWVPYPREFRRSRWLDIEAILKQESGNKSGRELALWVLENRKFCWPVYYQRDLLCTLPKPVQYVLYGFREIEQPFIHPRLFGKFLAILIANDTCDQSSRESEVLARMSELEEAIKRCDYSFEKTIGYALLGQSYMMINKQSDAVEYFIRSYRLWPATEHCALWLIFKVCFDEFLRTQSVKNLEKDPGIQHKRTKIY